MRRRSSWGRKRRGLRWTRVLATTVVLAAGVALALLWGWQREPPPFATLEPTPANLLDLRDEHVRRELRRLVSGPRAEGLGADYSLLNRCAPGLPNTYAVLRTASFERDDYVELRRNQGDAGATAWHWRGIGLPPPPPPLGPYRPPETQPHGQAVLSAVGTDDFAAIEREFLALTHSRIELIRSIDGLDGGSMTLEFCRGGQYGLFVRKNVLDDADDRRIVDLGDRMLVLAGLRPH